jgi:hypothetical protein
MTGTAGEHRARWSQVHCLTLTKGRHRNEPMHRYNTCGHHSPARGNQGCCSSPKQPCCKPRGQHTTEDRDGTVTKQMRSLPTSPQDVMMVPRSAPDKSICESFHPGLAMVEEALAMSCVQISQGKGAEFHCNWSRLFQG